VRRKFPEGRKLPERRTGSELEELKGCFECEGTPSINYCQKSCFLPLKEKMAKKRSYGGCHFILPVFFKWKWQKRAKPTVNSRGAFFFISLFERFKYSIIYWELDFKYKSKKVYYLFNILI
jgi:hypothetical protein